MMRNKKTKTAFKLHILNNFKRINKKYPDELNLPSSLKQLKRLIKCLNKEYYNNENIPYWFIAYFTNTYKNEKWQYF